MTLHSNTSRSGAVYLVLIGIAILFFIFSPTITSAQLSETPIPGRESEGTMADGLRTPGGNTNAAPATAPVATPPPTNTTRANLNYQPLVGIPGVSNAGSDFGTYLNQLYFLAISLAALLAVIKIIIAGVKYMLADVVTSKADAKNDIWGSLLGLLLIIAAFLILSTVNPTLTNLNVLSGAPALRPLQGGGGSGGVGTTVGSGSGVTTPNTTGGVSTAPVQRPGMSFNQISVQAQRAAEADCNNRTGFYRSYVYRVIDADATERLNNGTIVYTTRTSEPTGDMPNRDLVRIDCNPIQ